MNRTTILSIAFSLSMLMLTGACSDTPAGLVDQEPDAQLSAMVINPHPFRIPFANTQFWACSNEIVDFEGWFNVTVRVVVSHSGNTTLQVHVTSHVKGVGRTTGDQYVSNESTNLTVRSGGDGFVTTFQFRINRISKGKEPNSAGWIKLHMTFDANGRPTSFKDEAEFDVCRG